MIRVCVLGHRGMLGHVVARYLAEQGCQVTTVGRRFSAESHYPFLDELLAGRPDWCVNCIGARRQQVNSRRELFAVNAFLPRFCSTRLPRSVGFIQASSDGVFDPLIPARQVDDIPDATDEYGLSKTLGERALRGEKQFILRCSIIGPEQYKATSLFSWFLSQKAAVQGYCNQSWNGITTLEWAKQCWELIQGNRRALGPVLQPGTWPAVSKKQVLDLIGRIWQHPVAVQPGQAAFPVFRTLVPNTVCPPLADQLLELCRWYEPLLLPKGRANQ
jgi:dTDP-4-dehydrorhamnose reductase